ncbi:hypothetical protein E2320_004148, partial [Naja naja]|jgi:hypothetical protein
MAALK